MFRLKLGQNTRAGRRGGVLTLRKGRGAGYIGGFTAYIAVKSGSREWADRHSGGRLHRTAALYEYIRIGGLEFGVTQNANLVPYPNWS